MAKLKYNADISSNNIPVCNLLTLGFPNSVEITFNFSSNFISFLKINITRNEIIFFQIQEQESRTPKSEFVDAGVS